MKTRLGQKLALLLAASAALASCAPHATGPARPEDAAAFARATSAPLDAPPAGTCAESDVTGDYGGAGASAGWAPLVGVSCAGDCFASASRWSAVATATGEANHTRATCQVRSPVTGR